MRGWPVYLDQDTILKRYDGRSRLFQEVFDKEFADKFRQEHHLRAPLIDDMVASALSGTASSSGLQELRRRRAVRHGGPGFGSLGLMTRC